MISRWFRKSSQQTVTRQARKRPRQTFAPRLEELEARDCPSVDLLYPQGSLTALVNGRNIQITDSVLNAGNQSTNTTFKVKYYLSMDASITGSDILLGSRTVASGLAAGSTSSATNVFTSPADLQPGNWYVGAIADANTSINESNENNNTIASGTTFAFKPDLVLTALTAKVTTSGKVAVTSTFVNQGNAATADGFETYFYLSSDTTLNDQPYPFGDYFLGSRSRGASLEVGGSSSNTNNYAVSPNLTAGDYYVVGWVDAHGDFPPPSALEYESNETNNISATSSTLSIRSDLYLSGLNATLTSVETDIVRPALRITDTLRNQGPLPVSNVRINYYLSQDSTITTGDLFLGSRISTETVDAEGRDEATNTFTLPPSFPGGTWYVGAIVDPLNAVSELSETNNTRADAAMSLPVAPNEPPIADAGADRNGVANVLLPFVNLHSTDVDGTIVSYDWNWGDGTSTHIQLPIQGPIYEDGGPFGHTFAAGVYTVTLTVMDNRGATDTDTAVITIYPNLAPIVNAGPDLYAVAGTDVPFLLTASDPDSRIVSYFWEWGDGQSEGVVYWNSGTPSARVERTHNYATPGVYTVTFTVFDEGGAVSIDTALVTILGVTPTTPQAYLDNTWAMLGQIASTYDPQHPEELTQFLAMVEANSQGSNSVLFYSTAPSGLVTVDEVTVLRDAQGRITTLRHYFPGPGYGYFQYMFLYDDTTGAVTLIGFGMAVM